MDPLAKKLAALVLSREHALIGALKCSEHGRPPEISVTWLEDGGASACIEGCCPAFEAIVHGERNRLKGM